MRNEFFQKIRNKTENMDGEKTTKQSKSKTKQKDFQCKIRISNLRVLLHVQ